jgi:hypothetical protein
VNVCAGCSLAETTVFAERTATQPMHYVIACDEGMRACLHVFPTLTAHRVRDVTARYLRHMTALPVTRKLRVDDDWWTHTITCANAHYPPTLRDRLEDLQLTGLRALIARVIF